MAAFRVFMLGKLFLLLFVFAVVAALCLNPAFLSVNFLLLKL